MLNTKKIGYWMSEKKLQKLNWIEFAKVCEKHGFQLVQLDLEKSLDSQGPFMVFIHKLTDIIALANHGDKKSQEIMAKIENWVLRHPMMQILDPLENVHKILDRCLSYSIVHKSDSFHDRVFTPTFAEITRNDSDCETDEELKKAGVQYPFICKPSAAHGSKQAHKMCIIFHERFLKDCNPPCVAQTFINHNAILYKIFIVGDSYHVVERPSLKNFYAEERPTIFFDSQDVSKAASCSSLSVLDPEDRNRRLLKPDPEMLKEIVQTTRKELGMSLLGVDVILENETGKYAIIDINVFPGYDGYPNFFNTLIKCIENRCSSSLDLDQDSGFDTG